MIKNHYQQVDTFIAKPQNCTMVYIAAGGMTAKDVWNALGEQNIDQKKTFQEKSADGKLIPFQWDRTPTGQAILVGEWGEALPLGLPEGIERGSYGTKALSVCNPDEKDFRSTADLRDDISYIDGTAWYGYPMLSLKLIQSFKLVLKIDLDVGFFRPMVFDLRNEMKNMVFAHTSKFCAGGQNGMGTFKAAKDEYVRQRGIQPASAGNKRFERGTDDYYTNLVVFNMSFFGSPAVVDYASFLHHRPCGFYWAGWGNQMLYSSFMGMFLGPNFEDYTLDLSELRCADSKQCWATPKEPHCPPNSIFHHNPIKESQKEDWEQSNHPWKQLNHADGITFEQAMIATDNKLRRGSRSCTGDNPPVC